MKRFVVTITKPDELGELQEMSWSRVMQILAVVLHDVQNEVCVCEARMIDEYQLETQALDS